MRVVFGIGIGERGKKYGGGKIRVETAEAVILYAMNMITADHGGCFVQRGEGQWKDKAGHMVREPGITITIDLPAGAELTADDVDTEAEWLGELFQQDSVIVSVIPSQVRFIS